MVHGAVLRQSLGCKVVSVDEEPNSDLSSAPSI